MRTLKKTLSLVLVVAMVLGLCVVGASATNKVDGYEDAGKIGAAYTEAVGVMTGLGIVDGVTDTELRPENTYQRDQAAKIIAYMLLGKDKAEKLSCTKAPFEDVPANHWAAGYIAFCKDVGIIDGVTETEFKPTAALTGFQWAKMLLSAVGFGVNGELEGDEWSIKTHVFGNAVNLFDGDIAAATHNALQRQQAMLLAFNVLTDVNVVVWSEALGDYIEGYYTFADRYTYQGTLGKNVWKLDSVTGIIIDNEGIGASDTIVDPADPTKANVTVDAGTGLDMMYHAARVWYVVGTKATGATYNTGVYAYDLAKVETTNCPSATAIAALKGNYKTIGEDGVADAVPYQLDVIDNTAIDAGKTNVVFNYYVTSRGPVSTAADTTVIGPGNGVGPAVPNSKIMTDISAIDYRDPIIVLYATSTTQKVSDGAYAYYVYSPTATSGVITKVADNGTVTLRDGTVIAKSNLATRDLGKDDVGVSYTFTLDTHGHWMTVSANLNLVYYTGAYERVSGSYVGEEVYNVQVADVQTGVATNVRVDGAWKNNVNGPVVDTVNMTAGYYWLGEPNLNGVYTLTRWNPNYATDAGYVHSSRATFRATTGVQTMPNVDSTGAPAVYYTASSVKFIIASGSGSTYSYATYNSVAELLAGFNATGATTGTVSLRDMALTTVRTTVGNVDTTIVFAYNATATSRYVFVPYDIPASKWTSMGEIADGTVLYYYEKGAYLNGDLITIYTTVPEDIERGFYSVRVNALGYSVLRDAARWFYEAENVVKSGNNYAQDSTSGLRQFASDAKILDFRKGVLAVKLDAITALELFNYYNEPALQLAYTLNAAGEIDVCYVVEKNLGRVTLTKDNTWTEKGVWDIEDFECIRSGSHEYEDAVTFKLAPSGDYKLAEGAKVDVYLKLTKVDNTPITPITIKIPACTADKDGKVAVSFKTSDFKDSQGNPYSGDYSYDVEISNVLFPTFTVSLSNILAGDFNVYARIGGVWEDNSTTSVTVSDLAPSQKFEVGITRAEVPAGTFFTVTVDGLPKTSYDVNANAYGGDWFYNGTPTSTSDVLLKNATAVYQFSLADANIANWAFTVSADNTVTYEPVRVGDVVDITLTNIAEADKGVQHPYGAFGGQTVMSQESSNDAVSYVYNFKNVLPTTVVVEDGINVVNVAIQGWKDDDDSADIL